VDRGADGNADFPQKNKVLPNCLLVIRSTLTFPNGGKSLWILFS